MNNMTHHGLVVSQEFVDESWRVQEQGVWVCVLQNEGGGRKWHSHDARQGGGYKVGTPPWFSQVFSTHSLSPTSTCYRSEVQVCASM